MGKSVRRGDSGSDLKLLREEIQKLRDELDLLRNQARSSNGSSGGRLIKMDKFSGTDGSIPASNWLAQYERTANLYEWSDQWKADNFHMHLTGIAHGWHCSCIHGEKSWPELRNLFLKQLAGSKDEAYDQMMDSSWDPAAEPLGDFYHRMCTLGGACDQDEDFIIRCLKRAMPAEYRGLLSVCNTQSVSEWYAKMSDIVSSSQVRRSEPKKRSIAAIGGYGQRSGADGRPVIKRRRYRCYNCGSEEHLIAECPEPKRNQLSYAEPRDAKVAPPVAAAVASLGEVSKSASD